VVRALSNYVVVMRNGVIVEQGTAEELFTKPKEDYTKALIAAAIHLQTAPQGVVRQ
jgi:microcin C transport system ATP-binding protein